MRAQLTCFDQRCVTELDDGSNDIRLRLPDERIVDLNRPANGCAEERSKSLQDQRVSCSRRWGADDLFAYRQIDADHSIFKQADPRISKEVGHNAGDSGVKK